MLSSRCSKVRTSARLATTRWQPVWGLEDSWDFAVAVGDEVILANFPSFLDWPFQDPFDSKGKTCDAFR